MREQRRAVKRTEELSRVRETQKNGEDEDDERVLERL